MWWVGGDYDFGFAMAKAEQKEQILCAQEERNSHINFLNILYIVKISIQCVII